MTEVVRSAITGPDSSRVLSTSTPKDHTADKHDIPSSHFKLTTRQTIPGLALK